MKSAIYLGQRNVEVRELPNPVCGDNDVIIQNIYSSICGTDVAVYTKRPNTGHRIHVGGEFGHETVSWPRSTAPKKQSKMVCCNTGCPQIQSRTG